MRKAIEELLVEMVGERARVGVARIRESDLSAEEMVGAEAGIDGDEFLKAANDERTEEDDHHGDGDFGDDEYGVSAMMSAAAAIAGAERTDERKGGASCGKDSEEEGSDGADGEGEKEHRDVEADGLKERGVDAVSVCECETDHWES
jgi:hypothetical protein